VTGDPDGLTYAAAGVDVAAGERAVRLLAPLAAATHGPAVLGGVGGFAGLWAFDSERFRSPVLAASTDGVGTKLLVSQALDRHETVGIDLVAMVVDDLVVVGAEPLFLLDYLAVGRLVPERVAAIVGGIAAGCGIARCALLGGETAEHPDAMAEDAYDLSATGVGVVEHDRLLGPERVRPGDVLVGLASSGLHANGFSLVRRALARAGIEYTATVEGLDAPLGDVLLTPTRIYAPDMLDLLAAGVPVHALCHVTGGGIPGNLPRAMPHGLVGRVDWTSWSRPAIFDVIQRAGGVPDAEMARATNLGVGMIAVAPAAAVGDVLDFLVGRGHTSWVLGEVQQA